MSAARRIGLIWAEAEDGVIGRDGAMPWHVSEDLAHFAQITRGAPVVMGRATWDSLSPKYRPLPDRRNIVITRQNEWSDEGAEPARSVSAALEIAATSNSEWVWVIGGGEIFRQVMNDADRLEVTELSHPTDFSPRADDVRGPAIDADLFAVTTVDPVDGEHTSRSGIRYRFLRYDRISTVPDETASCSSHGRCVQRGMRG